MVPKGWEDYTLSEITKWSSGGTPSKSSKEYWNGDIPWISASSMRGHYYSDSDLKITELAVSEKAKMADKDNILLLVRGSMLWNKIPVGITTRRVAFNQDVKCISPILSKLDIDFLLYWFLAKENQLMGMVTGTGIGAGKLDTNDLQSLNVLLPPLPEQQKIAKILSTWDKAISITERLIENSTQQKKALMQQLLTGKKRLLDESGKRFEGEWEVVKLQSVLDLMRSGLSRKLENDNVGIAVIRSNNMGLKYTNNVDLKYWYLDDPQGANVSNYILDDGDLLVNFINSLSQIGKACIYRKNLDVDAIYTTNILRIKPNTEKVDPIYLYLLTKTANYDSYITSITKPAVNQASFTTKEFGNLEFNLPPLKEQQKIATVLTNADKEIELLEQQLADLQQEKKALMQVLLTGKKRVVVDGEIA